MNELSLRELESEMAVELPERNALSKVIIKQFSIHQTAKIVNVDSYNTTNTATNTLYFVVVNFHDFNYVTGG